MPSGAGIGASVVIGSWSGGGIIMASVIWSMFALVRVWIVGGVCLVSFRTAEGCRLLKALRSFQGLPNL